MEGSGSYNVFFGYQAGKGKASSSGGNNTYVGASSGSENTTGENNTFFGKSSGSANIGGSNNTFIGFESGTSNTSGNHNVVIGANTDINSGDTGKTRIKVGETGKREIFARLRFQKNSGGCNESDCISFLFSDFALPFIVRFSTKRIDQDYKKTSNLWNLYQSNFSLSRERNHHLNIGNYIRGEMKGSTLKVAGHEIVPAISKKYKMDVKEYISYNQALEDIKSIPLYTFRYKEWERFPWKKRMGIVSERLPRHFQLPLDGTHTQVDIPTLTGSMIASIKALDHRVKDLEQGDFRLGQNKDIKRSLASLDKDFRINGRKICLEGGLNCLMSSKKLKKNIKEFKADDQILEELVKIKLFNYKFKDKKIHTDKKRMGVISEELPKNLQVVQKEEFSKPDWPTLTGYIISSIKMLHKKITILYEKVSNIYQKIQSLKEFISKDKSLGDKKYKELKISIKKKIKEMEERIQVLEEENKELKKFKMNQNSYME